MNNEPVAYFVKDKQGWWAETDKETGIPFYTHPVKEQLTVEEILKYAKEFDIWIGKDDIEFIKFVLRKAQEK